jgi:hypothetical protein
MKEMEGEGTGKNFAIVIDEAHSSQGGKTASAMSKALGEMDEEDQINDALEKRIKSRKLLTTASYFAFTATPKNKTLELFGIPLPPDAEGKIKHVGMSECTPAELREAAALHPIAAVQSEYSIFSRDIEVDVIPACLEVGASLVAYSPLGRGMLTGRFRAEKLCEGDWRSTTPRFQGEAYAANLALAEEIEAVALAKSCTPAQIALAWVIGRGEHILALTGTTKLEHLKANLGACDLELSHAERITLDALAVRVVGSRYDTWGMAGING